VFHLFLQPLDIPLSRCNPQKARANAVTFQALIPNKRLQVVHGAHHVAVGGFEAFSSEQERRHEPQPDHGHGEDPLRLLAPQPTVFASAAPPRREGSALQPVGGHHAGEAANDGDIHRPAVLQWRGGV
jgi:hypothetical protein